MAAATTAAGDDEQDQARLDAISDGLLTRDAMKLYNWLSHRCFSDCVVSFYRRSLGRREEECVRSCVRKYLLLSATTAARFPHLADSSSTSSSSSSAAFDD